jgi:hypothetical protein
MGRGQLATATLLGALARYRSPLTRWCTIFALRIMAARAAPTLSSVAPPVASKEDVPVPVAHPLKLPEDTIEPLVSFSYLHRLVEQHLAVGAFGFQTRTSYPKLLRRQFIGLSLRAFRGGGWADLRNPHLRGQWCSWWPCCLHTTSTALCPMPPNTRLGRSRDPAPDCLV